MSAVTSSSVTSIKLHFCCLRPFFWSRNARSDEFWRHRSENRGKRKCVLRQLKASVWALLGIRSSKAMIKFGFYFKSTPCYFLEISLNSYLIRHDQLSMAFTGKIPQTICFKYNIFDTIRRVLFGDSIAYVAGVSKGLDRAFKALEKREGRARPGPRVSPVPKTPFPFPFKRLPRRLVAQWPRRLP